MFGKKKKKKKKKKPLKSQKGVKPKNRPPRPRVAGRSAVFDIVQDRRDQMLEEHGFARVNEPKKRTALDEIGDEIGEPVSQVSFFDDDGQPQMGIVPVTDVQQLTRGMVIDTIQEVRKTGNEQLQIRYRRDTDQHQQTEIDKVIHRWDQIYEGFLIPLFEKYPPLHLEDQYLKFLETLEDEEE